jgi:hypothetical protein
MEFKYANIGFPFFSRLLGERVIILTNFSTPLPVHSQNIFINTQIKFIFLEKQLISDYLFPILNYFNYLGNYKTTLYNSILSVRSFLIYVDKVLL